ncbi:hypothetical protein AADR41_17140 [Streptomyces sp. CLV115]|uniref:hypothetical protein n=1 Tax=Streptomyces sp. CLV115 TaxID=3138502 RepID=UPI00313EA6AD
MTIESVTALCCLDSIRAWAEDEARVASSTLVHVVPADGEAPGGTPNRGDWGMGMGDRRGTEVRREDAWAERLTEGVTVAVVLGLAFCLLAGPAVFFGTAARQLITDTGTTTFSRFVVPVISLVLVALPFGLACAVFRSGQRKGKRRLTAAVPAVLALLGGSVVPFATLCLAFVYAD